VPLPNYTLFDISLEFYIYGFFCLIFTFIILCFLISIRVYKRKRKGIKSAVYYYFLYRKIDTYWAFMLFTYFLIVIACVGFWYTSKNILYFLLGCFVPIMLICFINAYVHYVLNDYKILADVHKLNRINKKHNNKIDKLRSKVNGIHKKVLDESAN
jgi:small-conductance mechanosensitive channel